MRRSLLKSILFEATMSPHYKQISLMFTHGVLHKILSISALTDDQVKEISNKNSENENKESTPKIDPVYQQAMRQADALIQYIKEITFAQVTPIIIFDTDKRFGIVPYPVNVQVCIKEKDIKTLELALHIHITNETIKALEAKLDKIEEQIEIQRVNNTKKKFTMAKYQIITWGKRDGSIPISYEAFSSNPEVYLPTLETNNPSSQFKSMLFPPSPGLTPEENKKDNLSKLIGFANEELGILHTKSKQLEAEAEKLKMK